MADAALFVGWGTPVRGREAKALEVFNDAVAYWGGLQQAGDIESFEPVLLAPHGGELGGFALIRGSQAQIAALTEREDFQRLNTRSQMIVERFGVVSAVIGETLGEQMAMYGEVVREMEPAVA
jgi:hypothetical protein